MKVADYLIKKLEELGINDIFGLPGDYNFNILHAINANNTKFIGCTNELNSAYAADGYARIKGYGAVLTTYGVGELSAMNGIAGSYAENIPVVHIVGVPSTKNIEAKKLIHHNFQDVDYTRFIGAYKNVTALAVFLNRDNAKLEIDKALKVLVKEKKPIYIAIPEDIAILEISDREVSYDWMSDRDNLKKACSQIAEKILKSSKPLIIGDCLVKRFDAKIEFRELCAKSKIPFTNFLMGMDVVESSAEKYLGQYLGDYDNPNVKEYVDSSDCVICIGTINNDLNSFNIRLNKKSLITINGTNVNINGKIFSEIKMKDVLEELTSIIEPKEIYFKRTISGYEHKSTAGNKLSSDYIYPRLQEFFKENDVIFAETGTIPLGIANMKFENNMQIESQSLWCSIGWATPALLGAAIAKPNSRLILITGDGAHQCSALEIGNMAKYNLHPIVIILNNNGYTIERILSNTSGAEFNNIQQMSYAKFARVFSGDIWATKAETDEDFDKALKVTQIMNKMCYIEACTDNLDVPNLVNKVFGNNDNNIEDQNLEEQNFDFEEVESYEQETNGEYETIVHKSFDEGK